MKELISLLMLMFCLNVFGQKTIHVDELFYEAIRYHKSQQYAMAINNYDTILKYVDQKEIRRQVFIKRGLAKNGLKDYKSAILDFTESIQLDSTDMASFVDRGLAFYYDKNYNEAENDFSYVRNERGNQQMIENSTYWLVRIEQFRFNHQKAITYCNELIKANPEDAEFYFLRGVSHSALMQHKKSIRDYTKALKIKPSYIQALTNRGVAKINMLTTKGKLQPTKKETKSACKDLKKAYDMGDERNTSDLIFVYCKKN